MAFNFTPQDGLLDTVIFPDNPTTGAEARQQFMTLFNQIKDYLNSNTNTGVKGDTWWIQDGATGLIKQGGKAYINFSNTNYASTTITFPKPFTTKTCTIMATENGNNMTTQGVFNLACTGNSTVNFGLQAVDINATNRTGIVTVFWEATGY